MEFYYIDNCDKSKFYLELHQEYCLAVEELNLKILKKGEMIYLLRNRLKKYKSKIQNCKRCYNFFSVMFLKCNFIILEVKRIILHRISRKDDRKI